MPCCIVFYQVCKLVDCLSLIYKIIHYRKKDLLNRQKSMMELTRVIGQKLLFDGKHNQAVPAAVQSLRLQKPAFFHFELT